MKLDQYTVRIYDTLLSDRIDKLFKKTKDLYPTKNPFIAECIARGVEAIERDLFGEKNVESLNDLFDEIKLTVQKLERLTKLCEKNANEIKANVKINQKLLSCNYNLILGLAENVTPSKDVVEAGMLDDLPTRLAEFLEELLKIYNK